MVEIPEDLSRRITSLPSVRIPSAAECGEWLGVREKNVQIYAAAFECSDRNAFGNASNTLRMHVNILDTNI